MQRIAAISCFSLSLCLCTGLRTASGQYTEEETVLAATVVLNEALATPMKIPQSLAANAHGVAIIPNVLKGSFVIGARRGKGLLFVKDEKGIWHAPVFITLTGGNVGWQVGVQSSDVVLIFKTQKSVQGLLNRKLTLGADAAAAAGPVGRQGSVGTDGQLSAEIFSYARSRGLFAGVSIDGSVIQVDHMATGAYYRSPAPGQPPVVPPTANQLTVRIAELAGAAAVAEQAQVNNAYVQQHARDEADILRNQLATVAPELYELLDSQWRAYLALPANIFNHGAHPDPASMAVMLDRFKTVATDPRFSDLAARPQFQSVYGLLRHYVDSLQPTQSNLSLPPPPGARTAARP